MSQYGVIMLHCGLVAPRGDIELGRHSFSENCGVRFYSPLPVSASSIAPNLVLRIRLISVHKHIVPIAPSFFDHLQ